MIVSPENGDHRQRFQIEAIFDCLAGRIVQERDGHDKDRVRGNAVEQSRIRQDCLADHVGRIAIQVIQNEQDPARISVGGNLPGVIQQQVEVLAERIGILLDRLFHSFAPLAGCLAERTQAEQQLAKGVSTPSLALPKSHRPFHFLIFNPRHFAKLIHHHLDRPVRQRR